MRVLSLERIVIASFPQACHFLNLTRSQTWRCDPASNRELPGALKQRYKSKAGKTAYSKRLCTSLVEPHVIALLSFLPAAGCILRIALSFTMGKSNQGILLCCFGLKHDRFGHAESKPTFAAYTPYVSYGRGSKVQGSHLLMKPPSLHYRTTYLL